MADGRVSGGCSSPSQRSGICRLLFIKESLIPILPYCCLLSPGVRLKETTTHQPPQPGCGPPPCLQGSARPFPEEYIFFLFSPHFYRRFRAIHNFLLNTLLPVAPAHTPWHSLPSSSGQDQLSLIFEILWLTGFGRL